jgi:hypothetical protein
VKEDRHDENERGNLGPVGADRHRNRSDIAGVLGTEDGLGVAGVDPVGDWTGAPMPGLRRVRNLNDKGIWIFHMLVDGYSGKNMTVRKTRERIRRDE